MRCEPSCRTSASWCSFAQGASPKSGVNEGTFFPTYCLCRLIYTKMSHMSASGTTCEVTLDDEIHGDRWTPHSILDHSQHKTGRSAEPCSEGAEALMGLGALLRPTPRRVADKQSGALRAHRSLPSPCRARSYKGTSHGACQSSPELVLRRAVAVCGVQPQSTPCLCTSSRL